MCHSLKPARLLVALVPFLAAVGCDRFQASPGERPSVTTLLPEKTPKPKPEGSATSGQSAILRVLEADREKYRAGFGSLDPEAQPSALAKFITSYVEHLENSDATGCPYEFKAARQRHGKAWAQLKTALEKHPDAYDDIEFMDALGSLFRGDKNRGRKLGGDVMDAVERVNETYGEVYSLAEGYGVEFN